MASGFHAVLTKEFLAVYDDYQWARSIPAGRPSLVQSYATEANAWRWVLATAQHNGALISEDQRTVGWRVRVQFPDNSLPLTAPSVSEAGEPLVIKEEPSQESDKDQPASQTREEGASVCAYGPVSPQAVVVMRELILQIARAEGQDARGTFQWAEQNLGIRDVWNPAMAELFGETTIIHIAKLALRGSAVSLAERGLIPLSVALSNPLIYAGPNAPTGHEALFEGADVKGTPAGRHSSSPGGVPPAGRHSSSPGGVPPSGQ